MSEVETENEKSGEENDDGIIEGMETRDKDVPEEEKENLLELRGRMN